MATSSNLEEDISESNNGLETDAIPITQSSSISTNTEEASNQDKEIKKKHKSPNCIVQNTTFIADKIDSLQIGNTYHYSEIKKKKKSKKDKIRIEIPSEILESTNVFDGENIHVIEDYIGSDWKRLARRLGITDPQIECIDIDNRGYKVEEAIHQMIITWKKQNGDSATVGVMAKALKNIKKSDIAVKLSV